METSKKVLNVLEQKKETIKILPRQVKNRSNLNAEKAKTGKNRKENKEQKA